MTALDHAIYTATQTTWSVPRSISLSETSLQARELSQFLTNRRRVAQGDTVRGAAHIRYVSRHIVWEQTCTNCVDCVNGKVVVKVTQRQAYAGREDRRKHSSKQFSTPELEVGEWTVSRSGFFIPWKDSVPIV